MNAGFDISRLDIRERELGISLKIRDDIGYSWNLGLDVEVLWERDGVGAVEGVKGKRAEGASEKGTDVDGDVDGFHAINVEEEISDDICVRILRTVEHEEM